MNDTCSPSKVHALGSSLVAQPFLVKGKIENLHVLRPKNRVQACKGFWTPNFSKNHSFTETLFSDACNDSIILDDSSLSIHYLD